MGTLFMMFIIQNNTDGISKDLTIKMESEKIPYEQQLEIEKKYKKVIEQKEDDRFKIIRKWEYTGDRYYSNYAYGQCTWYAGHSVGNFGLDVSLGDAYEWYENARKNGIKVGHEPQKDSVIVFKKGDGYGKFGHVGYVTEVLNDYVIIKDMNYRGKWIITERIIDRNDERIRGYIYQEEKKED